MKKLLFVLMFFLGAYTAKAQKSDTTIYECPIKKDKHTPTVASNAVLYLSSCPEFPGGKKAYNKFLGKNLRWPDPVLDAQGRVYVGFIVEKNGSLTHIKVIRYLTPELDAEALRVIKLSPKWIPGRLNGKPVRCRYTVHIDFILAD